MKLNVAIKLTDINGKVLKQLVRDEGKPDKTEDITIKTVLVNAILIENPQKPMQGVEKIQRYELAKKINYAKSSVEVTEDEIALMKKSVLDNYPPLTAGQINEILENVKK